jgi:hypothetical protein
MWAGVGRRGRSERRHASQQGTPGRRPRVALLPLPPATTHYSAKLPRTCPQLPRVVNPSFRAPARSFLVEAPPNVCTPAHLAAAAAHVAGLAPEVFSLKVIQCRR